MKSISPYSISFEHAVGGKWYPNATNFPMLKHLFLCNEATGAVSISDSVGGVTLKGAGSSDVTVTNNGDGSITYDVSPQVLTAGSWAVPGGKKALAIVLGKPSSSGSQFIFGSSIALTSGSKAFRFSGIATTFPAAADGTTLVTGTATRTGDGTLAAYALEVNYGSTTGLALHTWDGTTWTDHATANIAALVSPDAFGASCLFGLGLTPALVAILYPTSALDAASLKAGVQWMFAELQAGRKRLYPGWYKVA